MVSTEKTRKILLTFSQLELVRGGFAERATTILTVHTSTCQVFYWAIMQIRSGSCPRINKKSNLH
jgi:hypothetical protein